MARRLAASVPRAGASRSGLAVIAARKLVVSGAVDIVREALDKLKDATDIDLDPERKAAMVSNLLVVLVSDKDATPVVNTGTIYA